MDGGAWWAAVYGLAKSRTRLSDFTPELGLLWGGLPLQVLSQTLVESCSPGHSGLELRAAGS